MPATPGLLALSWAIAERDDDAVARSLRADPSLAQARIVDGATRSEAKPYWLAPIGHYVYAGDTALHVAAAAHRSAWIGRLVAMGSDVRARNRRGAEPLHYAADGGPGSDAWNPRGQASAIARLIAAGADPNALDASGVAPLHRAVRTRCASAVQALIDGGADPELGNARGSTPLALATRTTGRGGSGSALARAQQVQIVAILENALGTRKTHRG